LCFRNPSVWDEITFPSDAVKAELQLYISSKLTPHPTKVRADIEVTCFGYDGIDAVKDALRTAEAENSPESQIKVKLVAPPLYVLASQCLDKTAGVKGLEDAIVRITERIQANGGNCTVKMAPKAVTEQDDAMLQELMEKRERENMQVSGDEDSESGDDE
jgi:translation initiation factor 2 subunit 1